jgi:amino acid transporter
MQEFKKALGFWDSVAVITAIVIGVGIFRVPAEIAGYLNSPYLILFAWFLGGCISMLGAFCYAELSSSFPKTGGNYVYLKDSYGPLAGFLFGWTELLVIRTGSIAAVSFISAQYLQSLLCVDKSLIKVIAVSIVLLFSFINMFGLGYGKRVHNFFTSINILALAGMVFFAFVSRKGNSSHFFQVPFPQGKGVLPSLGLALIPVLWTYGGWHENTFVAEEIKDASKTIPKALMTGVFIITILYLAVNFSYIYLMSVTDISRAELIGSDLFYMLFGNDGRKIFETIVVIASFGCINAMIITGSRITFAMAADNQLFAYLGKINKRFGAPVRAIAVNAIWSSILVLLGTFHKLLFFTGILVWLFFALAVAGIFILRRKFPDIKRPYKVWGYPIVPLIFIFICAALFFNTLIFNPIPAFLGLCLLASGVPVSLMSGLLKKKGAG